MKKYVGLSLSFCVKSVLEGKISVHQIEFIIPGFDFDGTFPERYYQIYWSNWTKRDVNSILSQLKFENKPKDVNINISNGCWWPAEDFNLEILKDHTKRIHL